MLKPRLIFVSGMPGSGKTTLARALADDLRVPLVGRDLIRTGMFVSAGAWHVPTVIPTSAQSIATFHDLLLWHLEAGVSVVADYVLRSDRIRDLDAVCSTADVRVVRTVADDSTARYLGRLAADPLAARPDVLAMRGFTSLEDMLRRAEGDLTDLAAVLLDPEERFPTLTVDTTEGYRPPLKEIRGFAVEGTGEPDVSKIPGSDFV